MSADILSVSDITKTYKHIWCSLCVHTGYEWLGEISIP